MLTMLQAVALGIDFWTDELSLDVDAADKDWFTALMYVAATGDGTRIYRLLMKGATIELEDKKGRTALFWAVMNQQKIAAEILYRNGADPHHSNKNGITPLEYATANYYFEIAEILSGTQPKNLKLHPRL